MSKKLGRGPWFVGILRDCVSGDTQIRVHTYCWRIPAILNALHDNRRWYMHQMMGPYDLLEDALAHTRLPGLQFWSQKPPTLKQIVLQKHQPVDMRTIRKLKKQRR